MPTKHPNNIRAKGRFATASAVAVAVAVVAITSASIAARGLSPVTSQTALDPTLAPAPPPVPDTDAVEVGLRFIPTVDGTVDAVRFYKTAENTGKHIGSLWTDTGSLLAQTTFRDETDSGWQTARLPAPVPVEAGEAYVASYHAPEGRYSSASDFFTSPSTRLSISLPAGAGVYSYGNHEFPADSWQNSNYFVDLTFTPTGFVQRPTEEPSFSPLEISPGAPSFSAASTVTFRTVDGGVNYYSGFADSLPSTPSYFPVGVWFESVLDPDQVARDRDAGINLYVELTADSDTSLLGKHLDAITSLDMPGVAGRLITDEADMWGGAGDAAWTGNNPGDGPICSPEASRCGYAIMSTILKRMPPESMLYSNYGKGVTFWNSDSEAARFVNEYQDVVSADNYWFTDPNICGSAEGGRLAGGRALDATECRLAANYGWTIDRLRDLVKPMGSKPVWAFIELGHPFTENSAPTITGPEIRAAAWSSIIHGARGVVYFNHNFGGDCVTQHVLRDHCGDEIRPTVRTLNRQIEALAPVLNSPFVYGATTSTGSLDQMTKVHDGQVYIFAASTRPSIQTSAIASTCIGTGPIAVIGENRLLSAVGGRFTDNFADGNAVHIYRAPANERCDHQH